MTAPTLANLHKLVGTPRDGALLRFSLGSEYLKAGDPASAAAPARGGGARPALFGGVEAARQGARRERRREAALEAYDQGIAVAETRGDKQAAKEMTVFARRLRKQLGQAS